jgi:hypothetical protein
MNCAAETTSCVLRRAVPKRVDYIPTSTVLTSARFARLALATLGPGPPPEFGQARDVVAMVKSTLIAPRVPPREPREQVLPARREILHFAKNSPPGKNFTFRLKSGLAPTLLTIGRQLAKVGLPKHCVETALPLPDPRGAPKTRRRYTTQHSCIWAATSRCRPPRLASESLAA